jgi:hypothetical protein
MTMPSPAPAAGQEPAGAIEAAAAALETARLGGQLDALSGADLQRLMAALVNAYCAKREGGEKFLPLAPNHDVTPTNIMVAASQLLRAGDLQVFELGMWQSWTGE